MTLKIQAHFVAGRRSRQLLRLGPKPPDPSSAPPSRLPKLMALAIKYDELLKRGDIRDYAALARTHSLDPGVITRVMNLRLLAPDIQEAILGLPAAPDGKGELHLKHVLPITRIIDWGKQRGVWRKLTCKVLAPTSDGLRPMCRARNTAISPRLVPTTNGALAGAVGARRPIIGDDPQ